MVRDSESAEIDRQQELKDDIVIWLWLAFLMGLLWLLGAWPPEIPIA